MNWRRTRRLYPGLAGRTRLLDGVCTQRWWGELAPYTDGVGTRRWWGELCQRTETVPRGPKSVTQVCYIPLLTPFLSYKGLCGFPQRFERPNNWMLHTVFRSNAFIHDVLLPILRRNLKYRQDWKESMDQDRKGKEPGQNRTRPDGTRTLAKQYNIK